MTRRGTKLKPVQEIMDLGLLREADDPALTRESSPKRTCGRSDRGRVSME